MNEDVKRFIESNPELLNNDLKLFIAKASNRLNGQQTEELMLALADAGIDFKEVSFLLLHNHLNFLFPTIGDKTSLEDFIKYDLCRYRCSTYLGLTRSELENYIITNAEKFSDDMFLEVDSEGQTIIRTNYDN